MRVLAVGAHPDDLEILCGGTLARYVRDGHDVVMCHATTGNMGSFVHSSEEISRIRLAEARSAAAVIGAEHATLGLADSEVNAADPEQKRLVVDLVRDARPDVIITHDPHDYMGDHNEISKLVFECSFHATCRTSRPIGPHHGNVTPIYYMDTVFGRRLRPDRVRRRQRRDRREGGHARGAQEPARLAARPRRRRHRRPDADGRPLPRQQCGAATRRASCRA